MSPKLKMVFAEMAKPQVNTEEDRVLFEERLDSFYKRMAIISSGSIVSGLFFLVYAHTQYENPDSIRIFNAWMIAVIIHMGVRQWNASGYFREAHTIEFIRRHLHFSEISVFVHAGIFGFACLFASIAGHSNDEILVPLLAGIGIASGSTITVSFSPRLIALYPPMMMGPSIVFLVFWGDDLKKMIGICILIIIYTTIQLSRSFHFALEEARTLRMAREKDVELIAAASEARDEFFAAINHDLRQPLFVMGALIEALNARRKNFESDKHLLRFCDGISESYDALNSLIQSLMDNETLTLSPTDLEEWLPEILRPMIPVAQKNDLDLFIQPSPARVLTDRNKLRRVITNLVTNAIDYTPSGHVLVKTRVEDGWAIISVEDTGIGIEEKYSKDIFRPFFRINANFLNRRRRNFGSGSGIGLSTVKRLTERLGGNVEVQSVPRKGSAFTIKLPVYTSMIEPSVPPPPKIMSHTEPLKGLVIILVEDNRMLLESVTFMLEDSGATVRTASSYGKFQRLLETIEMSPDLLVTDYMIDAEGTANGLDVINSIRHQYGEDFPCMILTGNLSVLDIAKNIKPEVLALLKPVRTPDFLEAISKIRSDQARVQLSRS